MEEYYDLTINMSELSVIYDLKKSVGLIQIPKSATLQEVIEFINDINFTISEDDELFEKWKKWMPNAFGEKEEGLI